MKRPYVDPSEDYQPRGRSRSRKPDVKAPDAPNLFDISNQAPDTPIRVNSPTSIDAAKEVKAATMTKRRAAVLRAVQSEPAGLARFQIAQRLGIPDHWITSSVDALITMTKIEESKTRTVVNPASGKPCAVLVAIESAEESAA